MSLDASHVRHTDSPPGSGRSSPVPRVTRRTVEDGLYKADKSLKRYAANIERALASWEIAPEEWADYIAFLSRLLKAIQTHPKDAPILPHSDAIAMRLAQCLNPALPSGVHQKALDVYNYVFAAFGNEYIASHLHEYLPGLAAVLSFASLTVRPGLYSLFEDHLVALSSWDLRPALKSIILGLLPAIEEENSEDFEHALSILQRLENKFAPPLGSEDIVTDAHGYFWQCLFLAVITSPSRRQGALNFLIRRLPRLIALIKQGTSDARQLSMPARCVISPEPGLLLRCFVCGLSDSQALIQRGFLDLLVTHLPLDSPVLGEPAGNADLDRLVTAAAHVLLRRDMSLNRRLWTWFLGPEPKQKDAPNTPTSPTLQRTTILDDRSNPQLRYFARYGKDTLRRCILNMLQSETTSASQKARPFRICLSLMDRWEIGGLLISEIFLPAMTSLHDYSLSASMEDTAEVLRSASLFFDGIEASLIWADLINLLNHAFEKQDSAISTLQQLVWIIRTFNINDEEMMSTHLPLAALYLLTNLQAIGVERQFKLEALSLAVKLIEAIPARTFQSKNDPQVIPNTADIPLPPDDINDSILGFYKGDQRTSPRLQLFTHSATLLDLMTSSIISILIQAAERLDVETFSKTSALLVSLLAKAERLALAHKENMARAIASMLDVRAGNRIPFPILSSSVTILLALTELNHEEGREALQDPAAVLVSHIWTSLSPEMPKYHVEAVRSFWQVQELIGHADTITAILNGLVNGSYEFAPDGAESIHRFSVLWNHTITSGGSKLGSGRRGSGMSVSADFKNQARAQEVLESPLFLVLDVLNTSTGLAFDVARRWLHGLSSLDQVFSILLAQLITLHELDVTQGCFSARIARRRHDEQLANLDYILGHLENIIRYGNDWTWQCLTRPKDDEKTVVLFLAESCIRLLCRHPRHNSEALSRRLISLLTLLLSGPAAPDLISLEFDATLMDHIVTCVQNDTSLLQSELLALVRLALKLRFTPIISGALGRQRSRGASISARRTSLALEFRPPTSASTKSIPQGPPSQLFTCLEFGFSSTKTHLHLDQWLTFLADALSYVSETIFSNLLPLVECFLNQLSITQIQMANLSRGTSVQGDIVTPEAVAMYLLEGLEMVLDRAYECLMTDVSAENIAKEHEQKPSFLGNAMSGVFKADGTPGRMSRSNNRLTVILALQDTIRVTLRMWLWASTSTKVSDFDSSSAATTAYNALKVRNKTRHLLEQIFSVEPLESLEVIIEHWSNAGSDQESSSAISLLHVMQVSRPKNVVPATLDALCSRTNPSAAMVTRNSSLTVNLSPSEVATFLSTYLDSTEDDAMDEVWPDCVAFLRDVLTNPLPHRQVLPHLLSIIVLLAEKLNNTNFGEQRKMRRELGDIFQRLLTATFTTLPSGYVAELSQDDSGANDGQAPQRVANERPMTLLPVLKRVVGKLDLILESSDRMVIAINNITASLLATTFKSRSFPRNVNKDLLDLIVRMTVKAPTAKAWKKELGDAFNDTKLLSSPEDIMVHGWFPVLHQWSLYDKERMPELIARLAPPATAGIMFGVGASAARLDADRKTQYNLRRICLLLLASPKDTYIAYLRSLEEKIAELFEANPASSPSAAIKAELFMLLRTLALSFSTLHLSPLWPIINNKMQYALMTLLPGRQHASDFNNLSLLQAAKLLDLLTALSPDEFQLHEWLYITDTSDAVYRPSDWTPSALSDQVAEMLSSNSSEDDNSVSESLTAGKRRPLLGDELPVDKDDIKALPRDEFVGAVFKPFLSQLSIHAYEGVYSLEQPDASVLRKNLLGDLLDLGTVVE